jgi:hypothetical protein
MVWNATGSKGDSAVDREVERQSRVREEAGKARFYRLWLPVDAVTKVTFVDDEKSPHGYEMPFVFMEHQLYLSNHWKNWFRCLGDPDDPKAYCPVCKMGNKSAVVSAYSVIDHTEWVDKTGVTHKDELKLLVCKTQVAKILRKALVKRGGSLRGWECEISRTAADSPNTGDLFEFDKMIKLPPNIVAPNYNEVFAPKTVEELNTLLKGHSVSADDDKVRFF